MKGKLPSILMCSCCSREASEVFVGDLVAGGAEVGDGVVRVLSVPDHEARARAPSYARVPKLHARTVPQVVDVREKRNAFLGPTCGSVSAQRLPSSVPAAARPSQIQGNGTPPRPDHIRAEKSLAFRANQDATEHGP
jgi:hypothetical protein